MQNKVKKVNHIYAQLSDLYPGLHITPECYGEGVYLMFGDKELHLSLDEDDMYLVEIKQAKILSQHRFNRFSDAKNFFIRSEVILGGSQC